jgi:hypothetical protein
MSAESKRRNDTVCTVIGTVFAALLPAAPARTETPDHDYPTLARVEYVQECLARNGSALANLYKCSCVIDRIAEAMKYDDFVEASTFAKYATLGGAGGGIFRDSDEAKEKSKLFHSVETSAYRSCGLGESLQPKK